MSPIYRQVTDKATGDVRLEPMIFPVMERVTQSTKTGKVLKREPYRQEFWGKVLGSRSGARVEIPFEVNRHHWIRSKAGTIRCAYCAHPMGTDRTGWSSWCSRQVSGPRRVLRCFRVLVK